MRAPQQRNRLVNARSRAIALPPERNEHKVMTMVAFSLASGIVVLWMAYLPTLANSLLSKLNVMPF